VNFSHSVVNFSFPFLSIDSKGLGHSKNIFPPPFLNFIDERMLNEKVKKKNTGRFTDGFRLLEHTTHK
jgi:hypothetical protein